MKITERIQAMGNTDYSRLVDCLHHPELTAYWSAATMNRIRPIINAVVRFERKTGAKVTTYDLEDIRNGIAYREKTALFMAIMDNIEHGIDMNGRTLYEKIDKPLIVLRTSKIVCEVSAFCMPNSITAIHMGLMRCMSIKPTEDLRQ